MDKELTIDVSSLMTADEAIELSRKSYNSNIQDEIAILDTAIRKACGKGENHIYVKDVSKAVKTFLSLKGYKMSFNQSTLAVMKGDNNVKIYWE